MSYAEKAQTILNAYQNIADGGDELETIYMSTRLSAVTAVDAMVHLLREIGYVVIKSGDGWCVEDANEG